MKQSLAGAWLAYAAAGIALSALGLLTALLLAQGAAREAVVGAAVVALVIQLITFALLLAVRDQPQLFLVGWLIGLVVRFAVLGVGAYGLEKWPSVPRAPALLAYVAFVFLLLLIEPVFLRWDLRKR